MSWNKNTINLSHLDETINILKDLNKKYILSVLAEVAGSGLNNSNGKVYPLRRLQYGTGQNKKVVLEHIVRTDDCDSDDIIYSTTFLLKEEPKNWKTVRIEKEI